MSEYQDFDLDRSTATAWDEFTDRLADVISVMDESGDLTIGTLAPEGRTAPFVRLSCTAHQQVVAEAASNASVSPEYQLTPQHIEQLHTLGWHDARADAPCAGPNFWRECSQDESAALARQVVAVLRDVYGVQHPVFLAPDQLAEVLHGSPAPVELAQLAEDDMVAVLPRDKAHLDALVDAELVHLFKRDPWRDAEGDVAIRVGSAMVFLRTTLDMAEIIVFSPVVHEVDGRSRAVEVLNDLNAEARWVRFQLVRDRVFVSMSVLAKPFVPAHLHQALRAVSDIADGIDEQLAAKLRGRTTFSS